MSGITSAKISPQIDKIVSTVLSVASAATMMLSVVPGISPNVQQMITTAVTDLEAAYNQYKANPNAATLDDVQAVIDTAIADVKKFLHP